MHMPHIVLHEKRITKNSFFFGCHKSHKFVSSLSLICLFQRTIISPIVSFVCLFMYFSNTRYEGEGLHIQDIEDTARAFTTIVINIFHISIDK